MSQSSTERGQQERSQQERQQQERQQEQDRYRQSQEDQARRGDQGWVSQIDQIQAGMSHIPQGQLEAQIVLQAIHNAADQANNAVRDLRWISAAQLLSSHTEQAAQMARQQVLQGQARAQGR
jgi:hypothetical protein